MFEFSLNKEIELNNLIQLLFGIDEGDDQPCLNILDGWLNDEELYKKFKNKASNWTTSPDLGAFDISVVGNRVLINFEVGVETEGDINMDTAELYININKSNIYKFIFYSETLDKE
jgi:hypothetical protein